jgi:arylsulfatase A-like enzyme
VRYNCPTLRNLLLYTRVALVLAIIGGGIFIASRSDFSSQSGPICSGCNVILISIDTLGADHTSIYNTYLDTTPFLKSKVQEGGFVFENAYSQAPWTLPSHTSMLTGKYPWDLNMWLPSDILPDDALTIAEQMKGVGYHTVAYSNGAFVRPGWHFDQGFDEFFGSVAEKDWEDVPKIFDDSATWIKGRDTTQPFFLFIHTFEVHDPYVEDGTDTIEIKEIAAANLAPNGPAVETTNRFREQYQQEIKKTDGALKDFFATLEALGVLKKTIIIITSDHGEEFGEHGTAGFHGVTTHRELLHVPLIIVTPNATTEQRVHGSVEVRSIPATILELTALPQNFTLAPSLVPFMSGIDLGDQTVRSATALDRTTLLNNFYNGYGAVELVPTVRFTEYVGPRTSSVLRGNFHLIETPDGARAVYDLGTDKAEQRPLVGSTTPALIELTRELEKLYE